MTDDTQGPIDRNARSISAGARVKLVRLPDDMRHQFNEDEWRDISSMVNEVFVVYEIDEEGHPWIEKWWGRAEDGENAYAHCLSLLPEQMEVVPQLIGLKPGGSSLQSPSLHGSL